MAQGQEVNVCDRCGHSLEDHDEDINGVMRCWNGCGYGNQCECRAPEPDGWSEYYANHPDDDHDEFLSDFQPE